jgi:hypothetical protein
MEPETALSVIQSVKPEIVVVTIIKSFVGKGTRTLCVGPLLTGSHERGHVFGLSNQASILRAMRMVFKCIIECLVLNGGHTNRFALIFFPSFELAWMMVLLRSQLAK